MTVNLAPCEQANQGTHYGVPVALDMLVASEQLPKSVIEKHEFLEELTWVAACVVVGEPCPLASLPPKRLPVCASQPQAKLGRQRCLNRDLMGALAVAIFQMLSLFREWR